MEVDTSVVGRPAIPGGTEEALSRLDYMVPPLHCPLRWTTP